MKERRFCLGELSEDCTPQDDPLRSHLLQAKQSTTLTKSGETCQDSCFDPLTKMAKSHLKEMPPPVVLASTGIGNHKLSHSVWIDRRQQILSEFTTNEKILIRTSFADNEALESFIIESSKIGVDRMAERLEALETGVEKEERLSASAYLSRLSHLNKLLGANWRAEKKVQSIKIAIQCTKTLGDTSNVRQFYPSKFVLVTDVLDNFAGLVAKRLNTLSTGGADGEDALAKDTAMNWYYKIASIRELLPRIYIEMALLPIYGYFSSEPLNAVIARIAAQIRGLADPLVSMYARCFLLRCAIRCNSIENATKGGIDWFDRLVTDAFDIGTMLDSAYSVDYAMLFSPALDFIFYVYLRRSRTLQQNPTNSIDPSKIFDKCCRQDYKCGWLYLCAFVSGIEASFVVENAVSILNQIYRSESIDKSIFCKLLIAFVDTLCDATHQSIGEADVIWNNYFEEIQSRFLAGQSTDEFFRLSSALIRYLHRFCDRKKQINRINRLLDRSHQILVANFTNRSTSSSIHFFLLTLLKETSCSSALFELIASPLFIKFLQAFRSKNEKESALKGVVEAIRDEMESRGAEHQLTNLILIDSILTIFEQLHDTFDALTPADEIRQVSEVIATFIWQSTFGDDFEAELEFLVRVRSIFGGGGCAVRLTPVLIEKAIAIVHRVEILLRHNRRKKRRQNRVEAFIKSIVAFIFITMPSIDSNQLLVSLSIQSAQIALCNSATGQSEAIIEHALTRIDSIDQHIDLVECLLSIIIAMPDNPEKNTLYLLNKFIESIDSTEYANAVKIRIDLSILNALVALKRPQLPYHFPTVMACDDLYGGDESFIAKVDEAIVDRYESILNHFSDCVTAASGGSDVALLALRFIDFLLSNKTASSTLTDNWPKKCGKLWRSIDSVGKRQMASYANSLHLRFPNQQILTL